MKLTYVEYFAITVSLCIVALIFIPLYKSITADGHVEYCYVETFTHRVPSQADVVLYDLMGYRLWRPDHRLTQNMASMEDVKKAAAQYGCELK